MLFLYMSLIYTLICFGIPSAIWALSKEALETIPTEVVIVLSVALFGLIFLTKYMQQCKRKRFLENVRSVCREKSYSCSQITYTGHSKLVPFSGESFTVTGKTSCKCVLAGGLKKFTLIENTNNGKIRISRDVKLFKIRVFRFSAYYSFNYSQNDKKILIIDKIPKNAYIAEPDNMFSLYEGLTVGDITIFSSSMFLMALKYDEVKELPLF